MHSYSLNGVLFKCSHEMGVWISEGFRLKGFGLVRVHCMNHVHLVYMPNTTCWCSKVCVDIASYPQQVVYQAYTPHGHDTQCLTLLSDVFLCLVEFPQKLALIVSVFDQF